ICSMFWTPCALATCAQISGSVQSSESITTVSNSCSSVASAWSAPMTSPNVCAIGNFTTSSASSPSSVWTKTALGAPAAKVDLPAVGPPYITFFGARGERPRWRDASEIAIRWLLPSGFGSGLIDLARSVRPCDLDSVHRLAYGLDPADSLLGCGPREYADSDDYRYRDYDDGHIHRAPARLRSSAAIRRQPWHQRITV